jgi:chromosomal replication initiator protein
LTFTRFVSTPENRAALLAVQQLADAFCANRLQRLPSPLFLYGPAGTGKTHLVSALVEEVSRRSADAVITLLPAAEWQAASPEEIACRSDLLIVEDLQHLGAGRTEFLPSAEAFIQVVDDLQTRQRPMVFTANAGPGQLGHLSARLSSRLAAGLVVGLEPLRASSRLALLLDKAQRRQLAVPRDVLAWLADHLTGSGREIDGALAQLDTLARLRDQPLDVDTVVAAFRDQVEATRPTVERIAQRVGRYFRVETRQLQSPQRYQSVVLPRQVGMYLARQLTDLSLEQIGAYFGGRDHSTVLHACRKIAQALDRDAGLSGAIRQLHADLG